MSDTPRTDAQLTTFTSISKLKKHFTSRTGTVNAEFARDLETELAAWREVAGDLHAALAASAPGVFPGCGDSAIRSAALEAYARLKTSTLHAPDSTLSHEL